MVRMTGRLNDSVGFYKPLASIGSTQVTTDVCRFCAAKVQNSYDGVLILFEPRNGFEWRSRID